MMTFEVAHGRFQWDGVMISARKLDRAGNVIKPGDYVRSDRPLDKLFKNKFVRIPDIHGEVPPSNSQTPSIAKAASPDRAPPVAHEARGESVDLESASESASESNLLKRLPKEAREVTSKFKNVPEGVPIHQHFDEYFATVDGVVRGPFKKAGLKSFLSSLGT